MKTAIICFTARGADTAARIREVLESIQNSENKEILKDRSASVRVWCAKAEFASQPVCKDPGGENWMEPLRKSLRQWTQEVFAEYGALVFVGATGIAVRSIAPFLKSKISDPAVLCVDELGKFVIPLVSGHLGGANALAAKLAKELGAVPVITTATDLNGRFAVDVFAEKNGMWICDMKLARRISAAVLDGRKIGFYSDFPLSGELPGELELSDGLPGELGARTRQREADRAREGDMSPDERPEAGKDWETFADGYGICVTLDERKQPYAQTLTLIPRIVSIGVGCKKDTDISVIEERISAVLHACGVSIHSVEHLASIDLKAREPGLLEFAQKFGISFVTYTAQELWQAPGEFEESAFVEVVTGVSNVCERSAVLASRGRLIRKKTAGDGVTVALAIRDWRVEFG